ncbi:MAG: hypothetical protein CSB47_07295 [Proteobacteria bacterium]|nr:MAG: hypothetical protein CSB47_07295 [Pseudomonadota bacterium]
MLLKPIAISRLLLAGSLCVFLAACDGTDDKPNLNPQTPSTGGTGSGGTGSGGTGSGGTGSEAPPTIKINALRMGLEDLYEDGSHYTKNMGGGDGNVIFMCEKEKPCNLLKIDVTTNEFVYVTKLTKDKAITVDYELTSAKGDVATILEDPKQARGTIELYSGSRGHQMMRFIFKPDGVSGGDWDLTFTLSNPKNPNKPSDGAVVVLGTVNVKVIDNSGTSAEVTPKINDTGVTYSAGVEKGSNGTTCADGSKQDCAAGRDVVYNDNANGHAGFDFTKLDENGGELANDDENWACVKDNVTNLVWERKTYAKYTYGEEDKRGLRDSQWDYSYYDESQGLGKKDNEESEWSPCGKIGNCTTAAYLAKLNAIQLCGKSNWQLPSKAELFDIVNLNSSDNEVVTQADWLMSIYTVPADETDPELVDTRYKRVRVSYWTRSVTATPDTRDGYSGPYSVKFDRVWTMLPNGEFTPEDPSSTYNKTGLIAVSK